MTVSRFLKRPLLVLLVLVTLTSVGCNRTLAERNALWEQATALEAENNRLRMTIDALTAENSRLLAENARLSAGTIQQPPPPPTTNQGTGFEGIDDVTADRTASRVTVNVASDILFASGQAELRDSAQQTLTQVAQVLRSEYAGREIHVVGYTDSDPIRQSGWDDNLELSLQRAASVHRYLGSAGVNEELLVAAGRGATNLLGTKAASRRVEIIVILSD